MGTLRSARVAGFLSIRGLRRGNRGILATTIVMMVLVYLNMLFLPSLIEGASAHTLDRLVETLTSDVVITPAAGATGIADAGAYTASVEKQPGVAAATALGLVGNRILHGSDSGTWSVYATEPAGFDRVFTTHENLIEGHWLKEGEADAIVLGVGIAGAGESKLSEFRNSLQDVRVGDRVKVQLTDGRFHEFKVRGVFDDELRPADAKAYVADAAAAKLLPGSAEAADSVYLKATAGTRPETVRREIEPLRKDVKIQTSSELEGPIAEQKSGFNLISDILKVVSALVAAITIFIVTYVDLVNRRRQVGIERAIGIRSGAIVASYCLKAIAYAVVGIVLGALAFKLAVVPFVAAHPFQFPNGPVTLAPEAGEMRRDGALLVIVAVLAALIPAWRSVRIRILDAIWG